MNLLVDDNGKVRKFNLASPACGTSLQGYLEVSYQKLVRVLGEPNAEGDGYKTDAEWLIYTPDGVATIYNYKDGGNYLGNQGLPVEDITTWHVGAHTLRPYGWVRKVLELGEEED